MDTTGEKQVGSPVPECESDEDTDIKIPSIVDSISPELIDNFQPLHERYFEKKYCTKFTTHSRNLDTCIRVHTNKVCVVFLSEKHSLLKNHQRIKVINFQVSPKVNRLKNAMTGKGKRGAQILTPDSILCFIETTDGQQYSVYCGIYGKLLEINDRLIEEPNILIEDLNEGYLAVILPDLRKHEDNMKSLKTKSEYKNENSFT